jgi:hypothetical protein
MAAVTQKKRFAPLLFVVGVAVFLLGWPATSWPTSWQQRPQASASPAIAIDHVALHVADLDASVAFYSGVFGLQEIPAAAKGRRWPWLGKGVALHPWGGVLSQWPTIVQCTFHSQVTILSRSWND